MKRHQTAIGTNSVQSTFLRGGQIFFHNARMYSQLLARLSIICIVLTSCIALGLTYLKTDVRDARLVSSRMMAGYWSRSDPNHSMTVIDADNTSHNMTAAEVLQNPVIRTRSDMFLRVLYTHLIVAGVAGFLALILMFWWFTSHGKQLGSDQHLRGAKVIPGRQLAIMVQAGNRAEQRRRRLKKYRPYSLAGIPYPYRMETSHTLVAGTTGAGKTQALAVLLAEIRRRGDRAIIYDKMRSFVPSFYDPSRGDQILNAMDARCANWTPFADATRYEDFYQMACALIPDPAGNADTFWVDSARIVFAVVAHKLHRQGYRTTRALLHKLLRTSHEELASFVENTIAASSISPKNAKTAESIRATLVTGLASLQVLERGQDERASFSIREWVQRNDCEACLFLTSRSDKHQTLRGLITVWLEIALTAIMAQERDPDRTIWIIADELPSLYKLPSLEKGLAEGRQYGAAYVLGIQTLSQLQSIYGRDTAHTITGLCRTKLLLNLADPDTAEIAAKYIGRAEVQRAQRGIGFGASDVRDGVNYTLQDKFDHLVLPEQLMRLPDLHGYLVPAAIYPTGEVEFPYHKLDQGQPGFVEQEDDPDEIDWHTFEPDIARPQPAEPERPAFEDPVWETDSQRRKTGAGDSLRTHPDAGLAAAVAAPVTAAAGQAGLLDDASSDGEDVHIAHDTPPDSTLEIHGGPEAFDAPEPGDPDYDPQAALDPASSAFNQYDQQLFAPGPEHELDER
jgi:type IV conjugative transfer system coupling protein TraD|tara:strand:- start:19755 stop:21968 length:2214 start_codon:yes stop_codon:yes gene_type:complete